MKYFKNLIVLLKYCLLTKCIQIILKNSREIFILYIFYNENNSSGFSLSFC